MKLSRFPAARAARGVPTGDMSPVVSQRTPTRLAMMRASTAGVTKIIPAPGANTPDANPTIAPPLGQLNRHAANPAGLLGTEPLHQRRDALNLLGMSLGEEGGHRIGAGGVEFAQHLPPVDLSRGGVWGRELTQRTRLHEAKRTIADGASDGVNLRRVVFLDERVDDLLRRGVEYLHEVVDWLCAQDGALVAGKVPRGEVRLSRLVRRLPQRLIDILEQGILHDGGDAIRLSCSGGRTRASERPLCRILNLPELRDELLHGVGGGDLSQRFGRAGFRHLRQGPAHRGRIRGDGRQLLGGEALCPCGDPLFQHVQGIIATPRARRPRRDRSKASSTRWGPNLGP